jgi:NADH-quinone oxidoreductase subunit F
VTVSPLLLAQPASSLGDFRAQGGYAVLERAYASARPDELVDLVEVAGLRGRGGAAFPTARKWRAALAQPGPRFLVCNGGEDEPGSLKDRLLMERYPHSLLEGMLLAAYSLGVDRAFLYVNADFRASLDSLRRALDEARQGGFFERTRIELVEAPPVYVAGEESAALEVIEGRPPLPRRKPPYPTEAGLWGRPTVINNVETFVAVSALARGGLEAYGAGTLLITLGGWIERPGVYEVALGTPLRSIVEGIGGGVRQGKPLKAFSPGGASTAYLDASQLDVRLDYADLQAAGSAVGCATLRVVPEGSCMVEEVLRFAPFFAEGSCGQCGPCVQGTRKIAAVSEEIRLGTRDRRPLELLARLGVRLRGMGICGLITGATAPAASAIALFPNDFEHHARYGVCPGLGRSNGVLRVSAHRPAWPSAAVPRRRPRPGAPRRWAWT